MASLRNAVKRIEHKERAQPASRRKLGLLEKHKDYGEPRTFHHGIPPQAATVNISVNTGAAIESNIHEVFSNQLLGLPRACIT